MYLEPRQPSATILVIGLQKAQCTPLEHNLVSGDRHLALGNRGWSWLEVKKLRHKSVRVHLIRRPIRRIGCLVDGGRR